ncbi:MAG: potassium transporter Kup [Alphaproteobacteria bacterium]|nr:potassium transporter Kup [Alphaproteobacteria bacterium]
MNTPDRPQGVEPAPQAPATDQTAAAAPSASTPPASGHGGEAVSAALVLGAMGVVFGDIGTSPLYMMKEAFGHAGGLKPSEGTVLGVLSLAFWSLLLIVTVKYVVFIMRADNKGEGGVLALAALALRAADPRTRKGKAVMVLAMFGLALFYGDGIITPAISVLSAVEGLNVATPVFEPYIVPIAVVILVLLFAVQSKGSASVGVVFGPVMCVWFGVLGVLGLVQIIQEPRVLLALNPYYGFAMLKAEGWHALAPLGATVLAVTGAEALYADMGHFGRQPIRFAWFSMVKPGLLLNYFGQGALILSDPKAVEHPFFLMVPDWGLYPMVFLATCATIIASQAIISGVFSLTHQAILLGYLPRMTIRHTSSEERGQIYIPRVNWGLMVSVVILVAGFGSSSGLAAAYGISVTGAMAIDAILACAIALWLWGWRAAVAVPLFGGLLLVDVGYFVANAIKIPDGGWLPLAVAVMCFVMFSTWRRGREVLHNRLGQDALPIEIFLRRMERAPNRVVGTAVYMTTRPNTVPHALLHNLKHNKILHERIILMTVLLEDVPWVKEKKRIEVQHLGKGFHTVIARFGFMDTPNVPHALELCKTRGLAFDMMETSFFLGRETLVPSPRSEMSRWRERLFIALSATASSATAFFRIPPNRVIELGVQIEV